MIDATSGAGGLPVDAPQFDTYYFAPQKSFGSDGGLWVAAHVAGRPAACQRDQGVGGRYIPPFLDLQTAIDNSVKDQTYNTPALATIVMMAEQVDWFNASGGLSFARRTLGVLGRRASTGGPTRSTTPRRTSSTPPSARRSIGTIDFAESVDAAELAKVLRANGIVDTEPYRKLGRNQLRIAMFPAIDPADVEALTACIDYVVGRARLTSPRPRAHDQGGDHADQQDGGQAPRPNDDQLTRRRSRRGRCGSLQL